MFRTAAGKPRRARGDLQRLKHFTGEHFALAAKTFALLHAEAGFLQPATHKTGGGEGRQGAAGSGQSGHRRKQLRCPHVRVFCGGKAVEKPGIYLPIKRIIELVGQLINIAKPQVQRDPTLVQQQTMAARDGQRPLRLQLLGPGCKFRPALVSKAQVVRFQRKFFETDEM